MYMIHLYFIKVLPLSVNTVAREFCTGEATDQNLQLLWQ